MPAVESQMLELGTTAPEFSLPDPAGHLHSLRDGAEAHLVMFICNHCPYVKAINQKLVRDTSDLRELGVNSVAIMSNDPADYPEDSFDNMKKAAREFGYPFPYLVDRSQDVARAYGAVCTPDFFGYNDRYELQYRGRLDASGRQATEGARRDLFLAMKQVAETGRGPEEQVASIGCSIKWRDERP